MVELIVRVAVVNMVPVLTEDAIVLVLIEITVVVDAILLELEDNEVVEAGLV